MPRRARRAARAGAPGRERARDRRSARSSASPLRASLRRGPRARSGTRHRCARGGRSLGSSASRSAAGTAPAKYFSRYGRTSGLSQSARLRLLRTCTTSATRPGSGRLVFILSTGLDSSGVRATSGSRASSLITRHRTQKRRSGDPARHWIRNRIDGWIESSLACRSSTNRTSDDSLEVLRRPPTARQRMQTENCCLTSPSSEIDTCRGLESTPRSFSMRASMPVLAYFAYHGLGDALTGLHPPQSACTSQERRGKYFARV
jgi:hypothetical protein